MTVTTSPPVAPKAIISWPGYGIMFFWQLGILQYLQETYDLAQCAMVGSSAGALLSVLAACGVQPQAALDRAYDLCVEHGVFRRPLGLLGVWGGIVRQWLHELLPADAVQRCSTGRIQVVLTTLPFLQRHVVSEFKDRDDLVATALASAHLPFILDWRLAASWRGRACVDGSLMYILTRRCRFLKPAGSSSCPLLLFDPFACGSRLLSAGSLARCISLAGNSKAAVQQLMHQGVLHAQRMAAAGAFAALPFRQKMQPAAEQQEVQEQEQDQHAMHQIDGVLNLQQQQQQEEEVASTIDLQGPQHQHLLPSKQRDKIRAKIGAEVLNICVNCSANQDSKGSAEGCTAVSCSVCSVAGMS